MKIVLSHLAAANLFTGEASRPILNCVAVADGLVLATDGFRLAVIGAPGLRPADLIALAQATPTESLTLIPSSVCATIATAAKGAPKNLVEYTLDYTVEGNVWTAVGGWFRSSGLLPNNHGGDYPNVANLLQTAAPGPAGCLGFNPVFLADYAKAIKLLTGRPASHHAPIVLHGAADRTGGGAYFSASPDEASMVVLQMTTKLTDATREWVKPSAAIAEAA